MKLLVVKLSAFGDIIHALPALDDLRARAREVHWLVDARYAFAAEALPPDVVVHRVRMKGGGRLRAVAAAIARLRRERFDAVVDLQGLVKSAVVARLVGGPVSGFDRRLLPERQAGWLQRAVRFHPDERHVVQQYRRIATGPFLPAADDGSAPASPLPYAPPCICAERRRQWRDAGRAMPAGDFAVLQTGGGWDTKRLPDATWLAVMRGLRERGLAPLLPWGNDNERRRAAQLADAGDGIALPHRPGMPELGAMLMAARVVIGPDTGLVHLAAALDTPTVSFWGPSASWRSGPLGPRHRHVESTPECGPCFRRRCDHFTCMDRIRADALLEACDALL